MRELISAEWLKARTGRALPLLVAAGVLLSLVTAVGYAGDGGAAVAAGTTDSAAVTGDVVRSFMMMFLFAGLFGAVLVTREYSSGTIARSVLLARRRGSLFGATIVVSAAVGAGFGVLAAGLGVVAGSILPRNFGVTPDWSADTVPTVAGVFGVCVIGAVWGALLGWVLRNQVGAVLAVVLLTLLVDPGLQRLIPGVANFTMTIAMSAVYLDPKPDLLPVGIALLVIAAWLAAAAALGRRFLLNRDVLS